MDFNSLLDLCGQWNKKPFFQSLNSLLGSYSNHQFTLEIYHLQRSTGAHPASYVAISIPLRNLNCLPEYIREEAFQLGFFDVLLRIFKKTVKEYVPSNLGADGSGSVHVVELGQQILKRNTIVFCEDQLEIRFNISFAGDQQSRFLGPENRILLEALSKAVEIFFDELKRQKPLIQKWIRICRNYFYLQSVLIEKGWVTFIQNGSSLPRISGDSDLPLSGNEKVVPFQSSPSLEKEVVLPGGEKVSGMVIPEGISLITGSGFHGKSTLLQAILYGIYPHIPGDGREGVVTRKDAIWIGTEEGRAIHDVDISPWIRNLPNRKDTHHFTTSRASGSTSQAAFTRESINAGSKLLLFDEDSSATNWLVEDSRLNNLIGKEDKTIQPLINTIRPLWKQKGVSFILVSGSLGNFIEIADHLIAMKQYRPYDCTDQATQLSKKAQTPPISQHLEWQTNRLRKISQDNFNPSYRNIRLKKKVPVRIKSDRLSMFKLEYGEDVLDLSIMKHLVDPGQTLSIGYFFLAMQKELEKEEHLYLEKIVESIWQSLEKEGLDILPTAWSVRHGFYTSIRLLDIYCAVNRLRSLNVLED